MARNLVSIVKEKMIEYYAGDSRRVHHFLKVHSFAKLIAEMEGMEPDEIMYMGDDVPDLELLVAGHHGSSGSTSEELLDALMALIEEL